MADNPANSRPRVLSGMRPTGKLHLGNYVGALQNWVKLQDTHECFFFVADWHALTTDYDDTSRLADNTKEVVLDYLGAGLDPKKCTIFVQSHVKQHAELHVLFSMITPLGWLERVPSYKEQQQQMPNKDLHMYGFLGYPLLQAADILIYRPGFVPVGEDQAAHVELTREVARRFNNFYDLKGKPIFPEPETLLTPSPKLLGTDKRKMSKSYGNTILLSDEAAQVEQKINGSTTDRPKLTDTGFPDRCPVGNLHQIFSDPLEKAAILEGCTTASITCQDCKRRAIRSIEPHLGPIRERRRQLAGDPELLQEIVRGGAQKAAKAAEATMKKVRESVGLLPRASVKDVAARQDMHLPLRVPASIGKAVGNEERWKIRTEPWLERVNKNYPLTPDRDTRRLFITQRRRKVGLYAECQGSDGRWHFELKDRPLNVLVLLAEDRDRYLHDYILPQSFLQQYWKHFEREIHQGGSTVLIVLKRDPNGASLALKDSDLPIQQYEGGYSALL